MPSVPLCLRTYVPFTITLFPVPCVPLCLCASVPVSFNA